MNTLVVGNGKGSWTVRGVQLGQAIGARVTSYPTKDDWAWADVAVLIKRAATTFAPLAHAAGVPVVWDALDFWKQPGDHHLGMVGARDLIRGWLKQIRPAVTIGATKAMADACDGVYLPHHSWDGLVPTPAREHVKVVAYEGNPIYLGLWNDRLTKACARRGWQFVINPPDLSQVDLLVAFRHGVWDGVLSREWKSGVKVVNAVAAGRPLIGQDSAARREIDHSGSITEEPFPHPTFEHAFDYWTPYEKRAAAVDIATTLAPFHRLPMIAEQYRAILKCATEATPCAA